jgi:hypothetical protein
VLASIAEPAPTIAHIAFLEITFAIVATLC